MTSDTTPEFEVKEDFLDKIASIPSRRERISWDRKHKNITALVDSLAPLEEEIQAIMAKKEPILEEVKALRLVMVKECVHPRELLVIARAEPAPTALCKFCNKNITLPVRSTLNDEIPDQP